ncbi:Monoterpene epsilon-lactone hydrolase [Zancudomyces culisetae]|uniref:Monoterpene epsilon-lactone hydrolase n=1 Tax=Zancudomyces culisetae TaxID=1213189 RepID=A0A1R1PZP0_ZANCU|nr:Monoterpene epsilon-lactone hydrolase [Zancudomyces culisetae]|eukprot:OMH86407.1 Monoterpene epsilon-lactone hydrolase [Zancudomyces culisetae]
MTDWLGLAYPKNGTDEEKAYYFAKIKEFEDETRLMYEKEGPKVSNWTLQKHITVDRLKKEVMLTKRTNTVFYTEENFDAEELGKNFKVMRNLTSNELRKSDEGKYASHNWVVDIDEVCDVKKIVDRIPIFAELVSKDKSEKNGGHGLRTHFAEVVASKKIIESNGGEEKGLSLNPLDKDEVVIVHYHGGGYCMITPGAYRTTGIELSNLTNHRVILPYYRLAPENPFPAPIYDGYMFLKYLHSLGHKQKNIILFGESAGGNLVLELLLVLEKLGEPQPRACISFSPWVNLDITTDSWDRNKKYDYLTSIPLDFVFNTSRMYAAPGKSLEEAKSVFKNPFASPIHGDYSFPECAPIYLISGELELLVDDIDNFASKYGVKPTVISGRKHPGFDFSLITDNDAEHTHRKKIIYEKYVGMIHTFFIFDEADEKHAFMDGVKNFLDSLQK